MLDRQITTEVGVVSGGPGDERRASIDSTIRLIKEESREPTSGLEPLT